MLVEFPDIEVIRVNVLENPQAALDRGISRTPAFASEERVLRGFFLGQRRIRKFLRSLGS